jgi:hypothetical protein
MTLNIPEALVLDYSTQFFTFSFEYMCMFLGISIVYRRDILPHDKALSKRFLRQVEQAYREASAASLANVRVRRGAILSEVPVEVLKQFVKASATGLRRSDFVQGIGR